MRDVELGTTEHVKGVLNATKQNMRSSHVHTAATEFVRNAIGFIAKRESIVTDVVKDQRDDASTVRHARLTSMSFSAAEKR